MITLFQFPAAFNVPNASPYCLKLETQFAPGRPGVSGEGRQRPAQRRPKGKLPYVRIEGEAIGDSEIVIRTPRRALRVTLDAGLDARGRAGHGRSRACATNTCTT